MATLTEQRTARWVTTTDKLCSTLVDDIRANTKIPSGAGAALVRSLERGLSAPIENLRFGSFNLKAEQTKFISGGSVPAVVHLAYGVASVPRALLAADSQSSLDKIQDTLCVFRYLELPRASCMDWPTWKDTFAQERSYFYINNEHLKLLDKYRTDPVAGGQRIACQAANLSYGYSVQLSWFAFLDRCLAANVSLRETLAGLSSLAGDKSSPEYIATLPTLAVSGNGQIAVVKYGYKTNSCRFLLSPVSPLKLPTPIGNKGHSSPLLPQQEQWLDEGYLDKFLLSAGIYPRSNGWGPENLAEIVRKQLLHDIDR